LKLNATEILPVVLNRQGIIGVDSLVRDIVSEVLIAAKEVDLSIWSQDNRIDNCHIRQPAGSNLQKSQDRALRAATKPGDTMFVSTRNDRFEPCIAHHFEKAEITLKMA
jgi:hypothetical protein